MKKQIQSVLLVAFFLGMMVPAWGQAPSTEGRDFWVTFLRAADDDPTELKLTISAKEACDVVIENAQTKYSEKRSVTDNSSTELVMSKANSYSSTSGTATYTALHVTATKDISLFAGNYRDKSFDATNVLPTAALLDDYIIQTYPPSDHDDKPQGSHFAIIAVEDGETIVDYNLTEKTEKEAKGAHSVTLKKGQVWYLWTGKNKDDEADLSGSTVKARDGKKIAVFQGCPHTNIPNHVRDRDHIISQAMPTAYWGTEFGITASRKHRRDIVAIMALYDGTQVFINSEDGEKVPVYTFDFSNDKKQYWTFEIGEELAYCADNEGQSPTHGKLKSPLVADSSCYITTSCPVGVHLFMVSNRYDNAVEKVSSDTLVSDPAMLWISPIEQVIKEINFATYKTAQAKFHFMNIVTTTANVANMKWNGQSIQNHFHPLRGNPDYSFARIEINHGSHNLKGDAGFLAHVYGYGERESYAYSCGSSTVARGMSFDGTSMLIDTINLTPVCVDDEIEMKINVGSSTFESILWDFDDGTTYTPPFSATNDEKKQAKHTYHTPGWYNLTVTINYANEQLCGGTQHQQTETMRVLFQVVRAETVELDPDKRCITLEEQDADPSKIDSAGITIMDTLEQDHCYDTLKIQPIYYGLVNKFEMQDDEAEFVRDSIKIGGKWYYDAPGIQPAPDTLDGANRWGCDSIVIRKLRVVTTLTFKVDTNSMHCCKGDTLKLPCTYTKGEFGKVWMVDLANPNDTITIPTDFLPNAEQDSIIFLPTKDFKPGRYQMRLYATDAVFTDTLLQFNFVIDVYYPSDIFKFKFNNVLAVYNPGYGGNKDSINFTAYQWYIDGIPVEGAVESVYYNGDDNPFKDSTEVYVMLTTVVNGDTLTLPSCSQILTNIPDYHKDAKDNANMAPAQKMLIDQRMYILKGKEQYNIYGQKVR